MEIFEALCLALECTDGLGIVADVIAAIASGPNRRARRKARKDGEIPPPRSGWTWTFLALTAVVSLTTLLLVLHHFST
jgi:hypothetical protein